MITVAFYGNSLVLATIAARVQRRTELQAVTINAVMPGAFEKLKALQPDVIVLDLGTGQPDPVMALWKTQPEILLMA
jgi:chemotaxis response regulator CheB